MTILRDDDSPCEVLVIGLGAMGSAALYHLSKQGVCARGIDQFAPPHANGSSHGDTRITRQAIGEGEAYTPLALRSYELWEQIEKESGTELLTITGGLIISSPPRVPGASSALHGNNDFVGSTRRSAKRFHIPHEILTANQMSERYPQLKLRGDETGYFEEKAGFLRPERCVEAQLRLAQQNGARVHTNEKVLSIVQQADGVVVTTNRGAEYRAKKLILTAGPWVSAFMPAAHRDLFRVYRQVLYWFDVSSDYAAFAPERFPVFIWDFNTDGGDGMYGFPAINGKKGGLKVAHEQYVETTDPAHLNRHVSDEETTLMYERFVESRFFGVGRTCLKSVCCLYTVTPDHGFIIDAHPEYKDVLVASPCSGHGFKHSAAIGEALAQLSTVGVSQTDISAFSLKRFD